jgi:hypothetical protein
LLYTQFLQETFKVVLLRSLSGEVAQARYLSGHLFSWLRRENVHNMSYFRPFDNFKKTAGERFVSLQEETFLVASLKLERLETTQSDIVL